MAKTVIQEKLKAMEDADARNKVPSIESLVKTLAHKIQDMEAASKKTAKK